MFFNTSNRSRARTYKWVKNDIILIRPRTYMSDRYLYWANSRMPCFILCDCYLPNIIINRFFVYNRVEFTPTTLSSDVFRSAMIFLPSAFCFTHNRIKRFRLPLRKYEHIFIASVVAWLTYLWHWIGLLPNHCVVEIEATLHKVESLSE